MFQRSRNLSTGDTMRYVNPQTLPGNGGGRFSPIEKYRVIVPSKVTLKKLLREKKFFFEMLKFFHGDLRKASKKKIFDGNFFPK